MPVLPTAGPGDIYRDLCHPCTLSHCRPRTLLAASAQISQNASKAARAGSRGCLSTKTSLGEQAALNRFLRRSLDPEEQWQGERGRCSAAGGHQLEVLSSSCSSTAQLCILPQGTWPVSSGLHSLPGTQDIHRPCPQGCWLLAWRGAAFKHFPVLIHQFLSAKE